MDIDNDEYCDSCAALFVLVMRLGGHIIIPANELPYRPYSICHRRNDNGDLEIIVTLDGMQS